MTESVCTYAGDRDEALVTFLYDDDSSVNGQRAAFAAHVAVCAVCREELDALRGVRTQLGRWTPPEPNFVIHQSISHQQPAVGNSAWWRTIPAWAQVAAALLFLGVAAGIANLDVHYDQQGLTVRTGWSRDARTNVSVASAGPSAAAPWKADLTALEQQLRADIRVARTSTASAPAAAMQPQTVSAQHTGDADLMRRLRAMVDDSEKRQQRELALRIAELLRDVNVQRQSDLAKVNRALGAVENNLGVEVLKTRQQVNLMYRASQVVR